MRPTHDVEAELLPYLSIREVDVLRSMEMGGLLPWHRGGFQRTTEDENRLTGGSFDNYTWPLPRTL